MSYYKVCEYCGCHLYPNERCDCRERTESEPRKSKEKPSPVLEHQGRQGR